VVDISRFCNIWRIDPASDRTGYKRCFVSLSKDFLQAKGLSSFAKRTSDPRQHKYLQSDLFVRLQDQSADVTERAIAGLCLRCYVSEPILNACLKIGRLFGGTQAFGYQDLLPFVLNDDGETLIVFAPDGKAQLALDANHSPHPTAYRWFSMQILRTFKSNAQSSMSLDNWVYLQTKQNPELKKFLSEFGFKPLSDWALLNRTRTKQFDDLAERDRHIIKAFHAIYRRDRHQHQHGMKRCQDPTNAQLQEMITVLKPRDIILSPTELMAELRRVAQLLRQYDIWSYREPLELEDLETGECVLRPDLPQPDASKLDVEQLEQNEVLSYFYEQLRFALGTAIQTELQNRVLQLKNSKGYAAFSDKYMQGLNLYYRSGMALKDVADVLGMSSWAQARRVFNLQELIRSIRGATLQQVLSQMLQKAQEKGLTCLPPDPDYLENLIQHIESLVDSEIFQEAFEEIQAGRNRQMKSIYAQKLCLYLEESAQANQEIYNV
jgi:hypothetical protein